MPLHEGEIWGEITEASLERLLERKGVSRSERGTMFRINTTGEEKNAWKPQHANFAITRETNGRIARGIADSNPLYVDESYAKKSMWGKIITPPATPSGGGSATSGTARCSPMSRWPRAPT
jgi:hypothetical protein